MQRRPHIIQPDKTTTKYLSLKRAQHQRKPTFDFTLPQPQPAFRLTYLLNDSKIYRRSSPFNRRPTTSKNIDEKRIEGTNSKNSRKSNPEKEGQAAGLNLSLDQKIKGAASSPNSRYKMPLTDRDRKEEKYQLIVESIKERTKVYKGVSLKDTQRMMSPLRREASPRYQRFVAKTPRGYSNPRHSRGLSNPPELDVTSRLPSPRRSIKAKVEQEENTGFQYTMRFSHRTKKGFTPSNPNKPNQDSHVICPNIHNKTFQHYFGVNDGHGALGHLVSTHLRHTLSTSYATATLTHPLESLPKLYRKAFTQLCQSTIDITFSGSTMVGCFLQHDKLYCCNSGDSRAVMGSRDSSGGWVATALSRDHKPTVKEEYQRIIKAGGRVEAFKDQDGKDIGPMRVWIKEEQVPGLAMTRSYGDLVAASVGVTWQPEIIEYTLTQKDQIVVIASDGVWQFLQNDYIISKLGYFYQNGKLEEACDWLLEASHSCWTQQCSIIDDITLIILFISYD